MAKHCLHSLLATAFNAGLSQLDFKTVCEKKRWVTKRNANMCLIRKVCVYL